MELSWHDNYFLNKDNCSYEESELLKASKTILVSNKLPKPKSTVLKDFGYHQHKHEVVTAQTSDEEDWYRHMDRMNILTFVGYYSLKRHIKEFSEQANIRILEYNSDVYKNIKQESYKLSENDKKRIDIIYCDFYRTILSPNKICYLLKDINILDQDVTHGTKNLGMALFELAAKRFLQWSKFDFLVIRQTASCQRRCDTVETTKEKLKRVVRVQSRLQKYGLRTCKEYVYPTLGGKTLMVTMSHLLYKNKDKQ